MKNIFEKLDLSGIEKAIMKDGCSVKYSMPTIKIQELVIVNQDDVVSTHYGIKTSFIPMIAQASRDYGSDKKTFFYEEDYSLQSILDLQCLKNNILLIEKENENFKVTLSDRRINSIVSVVNENLAFALNEMDCYIDNVNINDLLFLHKSCLDNSEIDKFNHVSKSRIKARKR